ncbi:hypothetical protein IU500_13485 [Nocardia terpenica]|uniref:MAB_1171c family putative transporter n=1 Tax=Nocardia terpenica TaxID=455432 RepID=UPI001894006E|nr:MAB_1171c family putative transporter [Nocardia terpenica]MBF6062810.1 hypothetical protein [Nocardia terpenica]MBF6105055.1 hypothetical protein [Nocardia terpenica]MBF6112508.1 hypothetical protein [Nocardia terpenica]MBF6118783.1 hypothetical protein [Nocardia terpenica]MBF6154252.1 hypothetical protein [Nocardia terpenica]
MIFFRGLELAAILALLWMFSLAVRKPDDMRLRSITALVVCWAMAFPFFHAASTGVDFLGLEPMWCQLIAHSLLVTGAYCLLCLFLFTAFEDRQAAVRARRQALVPVAVVIVLVAATMMMPADQRTVAAMLTANTHPAQPAVPGAGLFYMTANCYLGYSIMSAAVLTGRYARDSRYRLRRAMWTAMTGLAGLSFIIVIFVVGDIVYWAGVVMPSFLLALGMVISTPAAVLFLIGISYPAAVTRWAAARIWWYHLRAYHALGPLWTLLNAEFPEDELIRVPTSPLLDRFRVSDIHRRFYRRAIECRDGLVRISPYVAHVRATDSEHGDSPAVLAQQLRRALHTRAAGIDVPGRAVPIASPASSGLDADVQALLVLAEGLAPARAR